ncbi:MAG: PTS transporter subunit EIIC [Eubacterium sp.]|jgi:PTS system beta-glucosides-specific IIC component|nr:PTS transporter subunit EIIC [Eubacterium sp.]
MKYLDEAKQIVEYVGGEANINSLVHCATRLRFELKDEGKADKAALTGLSYVLQVVISGGQYQVVIGPAVHDYYTAILSVAKIGGAGNSADEEVKKQGSIMDRMMKVISGAFSPLIPLLAGAGMVKALLTVFTEFGVMGYEDSTYLILSAAGNAVFYFLPIFLGITLAKQFGANAYVGGGIGAALLEPNFTGLLEAENVNFLGIGVTPIDYASTIFPIFIAVIVYSYLEKGLKKIVKRELQLFLVPMLCIMLMVPFTVILFGPFGTTLANKVSDVVMLLFDFNQVIAGMLLGAAYPFLTLLGLHWGFTPITLQNLNDFGGDIIEGVCVCAVFAEIGIAIGAYIKAKKHSKIRDVAGPTILTGILAGVTEPILYGIIMNYKRMLAIVGIASGIGGAINGAFHVTCDAYVFHNIFSLAMRTYSPFAGYLAGIAAALASGALLTVFWGVTPGDSADFEAPGQAGSNGQQPAEQTGNVKQQKAAGQQTDIYAPLSGEAIALQDVEDEVFASGVAGLGIAIRPSKGEVTAPCDGVVSLVFASKHAIGITTAGGVELLIHIGLNTVMLEGKGFETLVQEGSQVKKGQPLLRFDMDLIKAAGYSLVSPVLVTNADDFQDIRIQKLGQVSAEEIIYQVIHFDR